jgi:hypothetical protein
LKLFGFEAMNIFELKSKVIEEIYANSKFEQTWMEIYQDQIKLNLEQHLSEQNRRELLG